MSPVEAALVAVAGVLAGAASAMAGGASLLSFPLLLGLGLPPLTANVTNTTGLVPIAIGAALASRRELAGQGPRLVFLAAPAVLGSLAGGAALLVAPPGVFAAVVPLLIGAAGALMLLQPWILARAAGVRSRGPASAWASTLVACVYAGYFGAAAAVLFMALVGLFTPIPIHQLNALKNVLMGVANATAMALFAFVAPVEWPVAAALAVGSLVGGAVGARLVRRVPAAALRRAIGVFSLAFAAWLALS